MDGDECNEDPNSKACLLARIEDYARRIEELLLENQTLRAQMLYWDVQTERQVVTADMRPRKIAKVKEDSAASSSKQIKNSALSADFPNINVRNSKARTNKVENQTEIPRVKQKVFQVINANVLGVRKNILDEGIADFELKQMNVNAPVKVKVTAEEATKVREALIKASASFHEYKLPEEKSPCFLIKGLTGVQESDLMDVKQQLMNQGLPSSLALSLFVTSSMRSKTGINQNSLVKLVLPPLCDTNILTKIKHLNYVAVHFETFKSKTVMQCLNCQRFGHSASGCRHPHRCVKCGANHLKDACPRTHDKSVKLHCCNCGKEHTANHLSVCEAFTKRFGSRKGDNKADLSKSPLPPPANSSVVTSDVSTSSPRRPGTSFASIVKNNKNKNNNINFNSSTSVVCASDDPSAMLKLVLSKIEMLTRTISRHENIISKLTSNG